MTTHDIALIPGDGIGPAVTEAAISVARAAGAALDCVTFPWSCDHYLRTGRMMPADAIETLRGFDAIFLGAVGWPAKVPDSVSLHGLLLPIRKAFVQYANIRPHRLLQGVEGPLKTRDFDILCIRENTEGEYSGAGGRVHVGTPDEVAVETSVFTRVGVERILRFGFEQAMARRGKLASIAAMMRAAWASRPQPISAPRAGRRCSSRCMVRPPTSPIWTSPTRWRRSGRW